jgi:hypothetical protein
MKRAAADGTSFNDFRNGMLDMMKEKGWYGGAGHTKDEKRYINWRIGVMYDTNMRTAYAQADYRDQLQGADLRPIWVYQSQVTGSNRRQEHIALHGKAFRWDDSFWDTYYPPNGWGCECYVVTESEQSAKKAGINVEDSKNVPLPEIDPIWKYNVGREALAPNFNKYQNLPQDALEKIYANYHRSMNGTRMSEGEFKTLLERTNEVDFHWIGIQYQVGNLEEKRYEALREAGVQDCKIMATDERLWHGTSDKNEGQKIEPEYFNELYKTINEPQYIYEEDVSALKKPYRVFHFVRDTNDHKKIKIILYTKPLKNSQMALQIRTMGKSTYEYNGKKYKSIKGTSGNYVFEVYFYLVLFCGLMKY